MATVADRLLRSENCFFEIDRDVLAEIGATLGTRAPGSTAASEKIAEAEELAEDVVEVLEDVGSKPAPEVGPPTPA